MRMCKKYFSPFSSGSSFNDLFYGYSYYDYVDYEMMKISRCWSDKRSHNYYFDLEISRNFSANWFFSRIKIR